MKICRFLFWTAAVIWLSAGASIASASIIISQYCEGASFDKYIELYNTGASAVDLAAGSYELSHWSNAGREAWKTDGAPTATQALTGVIPAGGTYIIKHSSAANPPYVVADQSNGTQGGVNFNGDDSVALWTGTTYSFASVVDAFGLTGNTAQDTSFVRAATITSGTTSDFNAADWVQFTNAQVASATSTSPEYLGYHAVVPEPSAFVLGVFAFAAAAIVMFRLRQTPPHATR